MPADQSAIFFMTPAEFRRWLHKNHATATELWMGLNKKHVVPRGLTWEQGVEEALCYGWIDSKSQRIDDASVRQRWTPRKPGSNWSNINIALIEKLIAEGRMQPAGLAAYEKRSPERSGIYSYENRANLKLPPEFSARLAADRKASAFWEIATTSYRTGCIHWVLSAKQEATREKRMNQLIDDSAAGRLIPPQRYGDTPAWVARAAEAARSA
ncbi:YdeI/OmpD-associated family protein [soil metagenome]